VGAPPSPWMLTIALGRGAWAIAGALVDAWAEPGVVTTRHRVRTPSAVSTADAQRGVPGEAVLGIPVVGRGSNCLGYTGPQEGTASPALIVAMSCARGPYQDRARPQRSRGRARRGRSRRHGYGPSLEESESFDRCRYCPVGSDPGACSNSNCAVCRRPRRLPEKPRRGPKAKRQAQGGAAYFPRHLRLLTSIGLIHRPRASVARILNPTSAAASGHRGRFIWRL
jgi:hypothetical protein